MIGLSRGDPRTYVRRVVLEVDGSQHFSRGRKARVFFFMDEFAALGNLAIIGDDAPGGEYLPSIKKPEET